MKQNVFDIIIVGGGMVGATLAGTLAKANFSVALVDAKQPSIKWSPETFDLRVSAITRSSQNLFEQINAWQGMTSLRATPYTDMHVWDATGDGEIHFDCADIGENNLGHIVENSVILKNVYAQLEQLDNISILTPCLLSKLTVKDDNAELLTEDGKRFNAKLIIGADGARSWVRTQANIETVGWSYHQKGIVATVRTEHTHQFTAWQRFLPTGPLALLPVDENHCSIVWSMDSEKADALLQLDDAAFIVELEQALGESPLGNISYISQRAAFPLSLQHAQEYIKSRIALVGDAAHTVHPLAGQGVNLGLLDAAALTEILERAKKQHRDIGLRYTLRKYERHRKADNLMMLGAMDGFKRLFGNEQPALRLARNVGLSITNQVSPLKNNIIKSAMGLTNALP